MCGILVVVSKRQEEKLFESEIVEMRDLMVHRGPDDAGIVMLRNNTVAMAHRRLAILDVSLSGHQPMRSKSGNYLCFNGEVYNYIELRKSLLEGVSLHSQSDTEVVLHLLEKLGVDAFKEFNGMWGLAFYDCDNNQLIISRDRFGVKPVYYYEDSNVLIVSSEIKPILKSRFYRREINEEAVEIYLKTGLVDGLEETFFKGIKRFPKASYGIFSFDNNSLINQKFYELENSIVEVSPCVEENIKTFQELFFDSIKIRLRSDVPVGTCLSGGLDSSSIYSVAAKLTNNNMSSFSARFEQKGYDESYYYRKVLDRHPGINREVIPDYKTFEDTLRKIIYSLEEPSLAMGVYPQWNVMQLASQNVTVLLNGQGGDEILAGYDPYYYYSMLDLLNNNKLAKSLEELFLLIKRKGGRMMYNIAKQILAGFLKRKRYDKFNGSSLNGKLYNEFCVDRLPALLKYEDKIGMAFSLETRLPFMDYRLVNFTFSLSEDYKINRGWSKSILRKSMESILPREVNYRKDKKGFPTPFEMILKQCKHLESYIPRGETDEWAKWRYVSLGLWKEEFQFV